jgi:hypothetical protein
MLFSLRRSSDFRRSDGFNGHAAISVDSRRMKAWDAMHEGRTTDWEEARKRG